VAIFVTNCQPLSTMLPRLDETSGQDKIRASTKAGKGVDAAMSCAATSRSLVWPLTQENGRRFEDQRLHITSIKNVEKIRAASRKAKEPVCFARPRVVCTKTERQGPSLPASARASSLRWRRRCRPRLRRSQQAVAWKHNSCHVDHGGKACFKPVVPEVLTPQNS